MALSALQTAWLQVFAYAEVFGDVYTIRQAWQRLPIRISWRKFLSERPKLSALPNKLLVAKTPLPLWVKQELTLLLQVLPWIPGLHSVWLTGSVAAGSAREADLDVLVIAQPRRLWLSRACLVVVSILLSKYRRRSEKGQAFRHWCFNLWLEPGSWNLGNRASLYSARECIQAFPIFESKAGNAPSFLRANTWVRAWLPQGYGSSLRRANKIFPKRTLLPALVFASWLDWCNVWCYWLQERHMRSWRSTEIVLLDRAFFHPQDISGSIAARYETICQSIGIPPWPESHTSSPDKPFRSLGPIKK